MSLSRIQRRHHNLAKRDSVLQRHLQNVTVITEQRSYKINVNYVSVKQLLYVTRF